jgi:drug/metabolite transporter (DMT)-like permease
MITWIGLVVVAQLMNASTVLIDKYLLVKTNGVRNPVAYAFYVSMLSGVVLVMVPFGFVSWPSLSLVGLSLLTAVSYVFSILLLYSVLKAAIPSDVIPVVGAVSAVTTFSLAFLFLHQDLPGGFLPAFILLTLGLLLISHFRFDRRSFCLTFLSGIFFGVSIFLVKIIFLDASFADGFFWSRIANVLVALPLLLLPANLAAIRGVVKKSSPDVKWLVVGNKALAGFSFIFILMAVKLGSVSVVNALSGLQFVFLLGFAYLGARLFPEIFHGEIHPHNFPHKIFGIALIVMGFLALFLLK